VLVVAGGLLRSQEGQDEQDVLYRALRDFNIPKILSQVKFRYTPIAGIEE
jgi:dynein heavy chain